MRIAINGFGRIGKNFLYAILEDKRAQEVLDIVIINTKATDAQATAHMFKYDSLMGTYDGTVAVEASMLSIDNKKIMLSSHIDPQELPWKKLAIDVVVDCSGAFTKREKAIAHLDCGADTVIISAPAEGDDITIIPGVNQHAYNKRKHKIISLGSCTTNALLPTLKIIDDNFGIRAGFMTTAHAYTNSQALLDREGSIDDLRKGRAAAINIIPTSTGASSQIKKVLPHLGDRVHAVSLRVPVAKVSLLDFTFVSTKELSTHVLHDVFRQAQEETFKGIVAITFEQLVSSDYSGNSHSVIIDGLLTDVVTQNMGKIFGWYDNEWAYSVRLKDFLLDIASQF